MPDRQIAQELRDDADREAPAAPGPDLPAAPARQRPLRRAAVYRRPIVDGREVRDTLWTRLANRTRSALTSQAEREEARLEARLGRRGSLTRSNTIAVLSPKGGVGKTTCTFILGNLLAGHLQLRCLAIDANPDFGTLGALARDGDRSERSLADVVAAMSHISSAAELRPFVSVLPTGLHLLAAPAHAEVMAELTPELYGQLTAFLSRFYEVILLDLGTGITGPIAQFAIGRADQTAVVTTPEWVTATTVLGALRHLEGEQASKLIVVLNQAPRSGSGDREAIEEEFRRQRIGRLVTIPYDERLRIMLDSGTYSVDALDRSTRMPVKELGAAVGGELV
jgi:MinD-like ATPase involved in chromosome partitioning or flagellar assembly